jgi:hypothetical protein
MSDEAKKAADRLEQALAENEKRKAAAAALHAEQAPERARLAALQALAEALPEPERRKVLDVAGVRRVSAAPEPPTHILGGGFVPPEPSPQPVRWAVWRALSHAQLWQVVALSLNLEPIKAMLDQVGRYPSRYARPGVPAEFLERLADCQRALSVAGPITPQGPLYSGMLQSPRCEVLVSEVAAFLVLAGFTVPDEMREPPQTVRAALPDAEPLPDVPKAAVPQPLTTGNLAHCFDGLRWSESEWKKPLGDKPKWLQSCVAIMGQRGARETQWNPVKVGAALVTDGHVTVNRMRARFQSHAMLRPWLDAWKAYEADYIDDN